MQLLPLLWHRTCKLSNKIKQKIAWWHFCIPNVYCKLDISYRRWPSFLYNSSGYLQEPILISSQLQLWTAFLRPKGVCLRGLPLHYLIKYFCLCTIGLNASHDSICSISPSFKTAARVAEKIWSIMDTIASIWCKNMLGLMFSKLPVFTSQKR